MWLLWDSVADMRMTQVLVNNGVIGIGTRNLILGSENQSKKLVFQPTSARLFCNFCQIFVICHFMNKFLVQLAFKIPFLLGEHTRKPGFWVPVALLVLLTFWWNVYGEKWKYPNFIACMFVRILGIGCICSKIELFYHISIAVAKY